MKKQLYTLCVTLGLSTLSIAQQQWQKINTGFELAECKLQVPSANTIYGLDPINSVLIRSFDSGASWSQIILPSDSAYGHHYRDIQFVTESIGFVWGECGSHFMAGTTPAILKTTDKGTTWTKITEGFNVNHGGVFGVHFVNENYGVAYVGGHDHAIGHLGTTESTSNMFVTFDGGNHWGGYAIDADDMPELVDHITFADEMNGYATGINNNLYISKTVDGGISWETQKMNEFYGSGTGLKFFDQNHGIMLANDSIYQTVNAGMNWTRSKYPFAGNIMAFDMLSPNEGFFAALNKIYFTSDGCQTWSQSFEENGTYINDIKHSGNKLYASTFGGSILKYNLSTTSVKERKNEQNPTFSLFPNPATSEFVSVIFPDNNTRNYTVEIIDLVGKTAKDFGTHNESSLKLNISNLEQGVYLCKIIADGKQTTKKLIIK